MSAALLRRALPKMQQLRRLDVARCWAPDEDGHDYESLDVDGFCDSLCHLTALTRLRLHGRLSQE